MKNWSRHIQWHPQQVTYPNSEAEIQQIVHQALQNDLKIRMIGTAHSFNPLWVNESILVSLDHYQGIISIDKELHRAVIKGGTKLSALGELLAEHGLAMENLGDIDAQSLAGTISTGTHGTGINFGTISTQVVAIKLINSLGELVECSQVENIDLFKSAQLSLGMLGIITEITLQCVPAYKLQLQSRQALLENVLLNLDDLILANRNFEFFCFPYSNKVWTKTSNLAVGEVDRVSMINYLTEYVLENYAFKVLCELARWFPSLNKTVSQISAGSIPNIEKVQYSHKVYATKRLVRFNEMEYNVPLSAHKDVLRDILKMIQRRKFNIHFPIENRVVKEDDIHLSPAYGRDSAYIAIHVYNKKDFKPYFSAAEEIFKSYGGRPHWGKMHFWTKSDVIQNYPMYEVFDRHRQQMDPQNIFLNTYLKNLFAS